MSQLDSRSTRPAGILVRRPRSSVYTGMLGVAAMALAIGSLLLLMEVQRYDWIWNFPWSQ